MFTPCYIIMSWVEECPEVEAVQVETTRISSQPIPIPTVPPTVEFPPPPPPPLPTVTQGTSKVYIRNLHADTSQENLVEILMMMTYASVQRPFVSNLTRGKRWAKFDIEAAAADDIIKRFNFVVGVMRGHAHAEYARS